MFSVTTAQPHRPRRKRQGLTTGSTRIISMAIHRVRFLQNPRSFVEWSVAMSLLLGIILIPPTRNLLRFLDSSQIHRFRFCGKFCSNKKQVHCLRIIRWSSCQYSVVTPPATKATLEKCKLFARIAVQGKQMYSVWAETNQQKYTINGQFVRRALVDMVKFSIIKYSIII